MLIDYIKKYSLVIFFLLLILGVYSFLFSEYRKMSVFEDYEDEIIKSDTPIAQEENIKEKSDLNHGEGIDDIVGFVAWKGTEPYPSLDWNNTKPELKTAVSDFEEKWGSKLSVRQAYRPEGYVNHIRSVWEIWRYSNKKEFIAGYNCTNFKHIDPEKVGELNKVQIDFINQEAKIHGFTTGDTPPACNSDHALGIAVDIFPPSDTQKYKEWIMMANSVGLCHNISGDEPHLGLVKYLSKDTNCMAY